MAVDPKQLIKYVVWQAGEFGKAVTETRLIKYLYLIDLYHARLRNGQTLTGWPWAFVHYGPYCSEAYAAMEEAAKYGFIEENYYESKHEDRDKFRLLSIDREERDEEPALAEELHIGIISPLQQIIRKHGDDTASLLDYVYYDTEPMRDAQPYQKLDFGLAQKVEILPRIEMKKLPSTTLKRGAGLIDKLKKKHKDALGDSLRRNKQKVKCGLYDDEYKQALKYFDDEDLPTGLEGVAKVVP